MSKTVKRKASADDSKSSKRKKTSVVSQIPSATDGVVRDDALRWKEVSLPDRMDDAEGFFGLEELEDVEVIKTDNGKDILFRPKSAKLIVQKGENGDDGNEWSGFEDDSNDMRSNLSTGELLAGPTQKQDAVSTESSKKTKSEKPNKEERKFVKTGGSELEESVTFSLLEDEAQELEQSSANIEAWRGLDLSSTILSAIASLGFSDPTPIQKAAIPPILEGNDVVGKAVTGSGKTLAFGLPIIERWYHERSSTKPQDNSPIAMILAPTRELAHQLTKHLTALSSSLDPSPRIVTVTGGLSILKQQRQLEHADIIIGTPGRLWEVINDSHGLIGKLKKIRFLVVDEADRLLSEGHFKEVEEIIDVLEREVINDPDVEDETKNAQDSKTRPDRQILVFSATFHKGLQQKLAGKQKQKKFADANLLSDQQSMEYLLKKLPFQANKKPTFVDANPVSQMAEKLSETILECGAMQKDLYLYSLLLSRQNESRRHNNADTSTAKPDRVSRILVFTNSISSVKRLVPLLQHLQLTHASILPLHSSMPQKSRLRSLERFTTPPSSLQSTGSLHTAILVATDVAARGLDIKGIDTIIHYHVPRTADAYVHRSGRTARSNTTGSSILLCSPDEILGVTRLISKIHTDKSPASQRPKDIGKLIDRLYISHNLIRQVEQRVSLAQKITEATQTNEKLNSEENWLKNAAEELGVEYDSDEFEEAGRRGKRGRGAGKARKQRKEAEMEGAGGRLIEWKGKLKEDLGRRIDFGDGMGGRSGKYLAGGAVDMEKLLREGR